VIPNDALNDELGQWSLSMPVNDRIDPRLRCATKRNTRLRVSELRSELKRTIGARVERAKGAASQELTSKIPRPSSEQRDASARLRTREFAISRDGTRSSGN